MADGPLPEGGIAISFDPFEDPVRETSYGETRGLAVYAALLAGAFLLLSAVLVFALAVAAPGDLAPMKISDHEMLRFAEKGYFPLSAAAVTLNRGALAFGANSQTFIFAGLIIFGAANSVRRGFLSERLRGWTNAAWIGGLAAVCLAPSFAPGITPQLIDYAVTGSWGGAKTTPIDVVYGQQGFNRLMLPTLFIFERAIAGALVIVALAYVMHDLGYRAREALEDFGFIQDEAEVGAAAHASARTHRAPNAGFETDEPGADSAFGHRDRSRTTSANTQGPEGKARGVLGVSAAASRREIERAYRSQMKRAHPDHGGSVERAAALNAARDTLLGRR